MGLALKIPRGSREATFAYANGPLTATWTLSTDHTGAQLVSTLESMLTFLRAMHMPETPRPATVHPLPVDLPAAAEAPELEVPAQVVDLMQHIAPKGEPAPYGPAAAAGDVARAQALGWELIPEDER